MKRTGAEIIVTLLKRFGIQGVTGIPDGANLPVYDMLYRHRIKHILARHEQSAGFIAQGIARSTGKAAVCLATSGPGAANLITALADAWLDSIPLVAITGQVPTSLIGTNAFQEIDTPGMTGSVTKRAYAVRDAAELLHILPEAFYLAESGRPGPVLIDVPKDIQLQSVDFTRWPTRHTPAAAPPDDRCFTELHNWAAVLNKAQRPVIYAGGGVIQSGAAFLLRELVEKNSIPVAMSLMGIGSFPPDTPLYLGLAGMHGSRYTNRLINEADLILALGVRFSDRAVGKPGTFTPQAESIHIDIAADEQYGHSPANTRRLTGDMRIMLKHLLAAAAYKKRTSWLQRVATVRAEFPLSPHDQQMRIPRKILRTLSDAVSPDTIITTDVGQHQIWVAQLYPFHYPRTFLTSGGSGTMGFGLPAAIGAALQFPDKKIVCISGDGSILMNIQELATIAENNLNITVIIMNNQNLGLVRQQQELFYQKHYFASRFSNRLNFAALGREFGITGITVKEGQDPEDSIKKAAAIAGPVIIDIPVPESAQVWPMVAPSASNCTVIGG